jgi:predicted phosphodiesterase
MKALILGDIHADWGNANDVIEAMEKKHPDLTHIFQVGDLGDGWDCHKPEHRHWEPKTKLPIHWLDGNHDQHEKLRTTGSTGNPRLIYQPRGSILELDGFRIMFFGGASSIDRAQRKQGVTWWPEERIEHGQIVDALQKGFEAGPIDCILSHDFPTGIPYFEAKRSMYKFDDGEADRDALEALLTQFKPRWWFFGHHHDFHCGQKGNMFWACAPIIDAVTCLIWDGTSVIVEKRKNYEFRGYQFP